ncbi:Serine/threonine-protein kinase Nek8 [Araneus ventricosus]|uniref:non-specific serine/threonine protein kinase n=1 Tax=Araneus ventricosus TaxID=182803 RepID=A0A4Y2SGF4_ARAVE|nr:Serine/threonine-protein kinase Nek8 [Araneus ventricosus]
MTLKRPFDASTLPALIMKIMKGSFEPVEGIYSHELRKLLLSMLHLDHNQRPTAAQIMCHPVMIKVIFKLYLDIGSIPCNKSVLSKSKRCLSVLLFENKYPHAVVLSSPPKAVVKSVSLGSEDKIGITGNGLLISWRIRPAISINSDEKRAEDQIPSYIPHVIDERVAINIISVVCGSSFCICLSDNGVVFAFGKASSGCLGLSCDRDINQPRIVESLFNHDIKSIACGPKHVLALSEENDIFVWGHGRSGCLGLGETGFQLLPQLVQITWKEKPEKIYCGADCSFVITKDSSVLACGSNRHNKLAMDSSEGHQIDETRVFTKIRSEPLHDARVVSVSSGKSHTVILNGTHFIYLHI